MFPALRSLERAAPGPTTAAERFRAHHAVRDLIERLAGPQPLVLVLEDLHWADGASIELVSHLLRRPPQAPVLVAGSFRTGQADRGLEQPSRPPRRRWPGAPCGARPPAALGRW